MRLGQLVEKYVAIMPSIVDDTYFGPLRTDSNQIRPSNVRVLTLALLEIRFLLMQCNIKILQEFFYPEHVGFPIGKADSPKVVILEIHYDNPNKVEGIS